MSAKALAQRRAAASRSRPGRRKLTSSEERDRLAASRLLKSLDLPSVKNAAKRIKLEERLLEVIGKELRGEKIDGDLVAKLTQALRSIEGPTVAAGVWDRTGRPRLSQLEVSADKAQPVLVIAPMDTWDEKEGAGAADRGSNGHAPSDS